MEEKESLSRKEKIRLAFIVGFIILAVLLALAGAIGYYAGMKYMYYHHENYTDKECLPCHFPVPVVSDELYNLGNDSYPYINYSDH